MDNNRVIYLPSSETIKHFYRDPYRNVYKINNIDMIILNIDGLLWFKFNDILKYYASIHQILNLSTSFINNIIHNHSSTFFELNHLYMFYLYYSDIYINEFGLLELLSHTNQIQNFFTEETQLIIYNIKLDYNNTLINTNNNRQKLQQEYNFRPILSDLYDYFIYKVDNSLKIITK